MPLLSIQKVNEGQACSIVNPIPTARLQPPAVWVEAQ